MSNIIFSDIDISLIKHNGSGDIFQIKNIDSIIVSIRNILLYNFQEKLFKPLFGSDIRNSLFELNTESTRNDLKIQIENCIKNYEKRVEIEEVEVIPDEDNYQIEIKLKFYIIGFDDIYERSIFLYKAR